MENKKEKVSVDGIIVYGTAVVLAIAGAFYFSHKTDIAREATRQFFSPVRAEIVNANNDKYPDLRILNQGGAEYILYGDANEGKWFNKEHKSKLEELSKKDIGDRK